MIKASKRARFFRGERNCHYDHIINKESNEKKTQAKTRHCQLTVLKITLYFRRLGKTPKGKEPFFFPAVLHRCGFSALPLVAEKLPFPLCFLEALHLKDLPVNLLKHSLQSPSKMRKIYFSLLKDTL
jgi:hypothetical protein